MDCCADGFLSYGMCKFYFSQWTDNKKTKKKTYRPTIIKIKRKLRDFSDKKTKTNDFKWCIATDKAGGKKSYTTKLALSRVKKKVLQHSFTLNKITGKMDDRNLPCEPRFQSYCRGAKQPHTKFVHIRKSLQPLE